MKKTLIAILALAAVACNKAEVIDSNPGEAIAFGDAFVDNATKAEDPSYNSTSLTQFQVYGTVEGVNIYNGNTVSKENAGYGEAWTCTGVTQYWVAGADYIFDAVVDATKVTTDETTGLPTSLNYVAATQKDMLHKRVETNGKPESGLVEFTFGHLLSKVKFTVVNESESTATNYRYTITGIKLTNTITEANYAIPAYTWTTVSTGTHAIKDMIIESGVTKECETEVLLVPGASVGIKFNVNVQIKNGENWTTLTTTEVIKNNVVTLGANNAYNFKVSVDLGDEIQFTASQLPSWNTVTPDVTL